ncbi:hypothetical protein TNCV_2675061 [Trichonephila clavipes]|nr:hypothetical protein TNCV_2675061 [Trichonephila clavipes]
MEDDGLYAEIERVARSDRSDFIHRALLSEVVYTRDGAKVMATIIFLKIPVRLENVTYTDVGTSSNSEDDFVMDCTHCTPFWHASLEPDKPAFRGNRSFKFQKLTYTKGYPNVFLSAYCSSVGPRVRSGQGNTRQTIVWQFYCGRDRFRGSGLSPYIDNGELSSKAVKRRQWAEGVRPSEHVSDTCWFVKKPAEWTIGGLWANGL